MDSSPILLAVTPDDTHYLRAFKDLLKGRRALYIEANPDSAGELELYARSQGVKYIISTNPTILRQLVSDNTNSRESIDNWAGSLWERNGITTLFINPLRQLYSVPYGKFIAERFTSKIVSPNDWARTPLFSWESAQPDNIQRWFDLFSKAILIASDIETVSWDDDPENPLRGERHTKIRSISYAGLWEDGKIHTIVLPIGDAPIEELDFWLAWMRKFNLLLASKVFQNGLYDSWHCVQYHAPFKSYLWDTQSLFHSWYPEFPKDLAFISAYTIHNVFYWKDMAKAASLHKQWEYNARDSWATLVSLLGILREAPDYVWQNNRIKFPLWAPILDCNLEGMNCDQEQRAVLLAKNIDKHKRSEQRLKLWFGESFNPRSPIQVRNLMHFYGSSDIQSTEEPDLRKFAERHPLNNVFVSEILNNREIGKRINTSIKPPDYSVSAAKTSKRKSPLLKRGRIYYALNPDGTDNTRLACKEGTSWTGVQIQNQERDAKESVKQFMAADKGWRLWEIDNGKSEAFTAANITGSRSYLETLRQDQEEGKDFHRMNGVKFFGLKYEEVPQELRDDACKRVIYGAQFNMTPPMLLRTMGEAAVDKAKRLLGLPLYYTRIQVCETLMLGFDKAYPEVRKDGYRAYVNEVMSTGKLVTPVEDPLLRWTRRCFGNPSKNKSDFNAVVAHKPANLSVLILNRGFKEGWWEIRNKNSKNIRFKAQIHDSILGQVRVGFEHLVFELKNIVQRKVVVIGIDGIKRTMEIPVEGKISAPGGTWAHMSKFKTLENLPQ